MARPEKVAAVDEIKGKIASSNAAVLTEYRGLTVTEIARLRAELRGSGTSYTIYKNTLAIRAVEAAELGELTDLLVGPTAWAFVDGDIVGAAKAIRDFARTNDNLVVKGGLLEGQILTADQVNQIAALPSREELLAKIAGVFKAPMYKTASLLSAIPRNMAYGFKALIDKRIESGETLPAEEAEEAPATDATETEGAALAAEGADAPEASAEDAGSPEPAAESAEESKEGGAEAPEAATTTSEEDAADSGTSADESAEVVSSDAASDEAEEEPSAGESAGASDTPAE